MWRSSDWSVKKKNVNIKFVTFVNNAGLTPVNQGFFSPKSANTDSLNHN